MAKKRASQNARSHKVFGQARKQSKMFRAALYARVSTSDQQTIPLQIRALRDYAARRGWAMAALLAVFATFEREILRERVRACLAHARQNGKDWADRQLRPFIQRTFGDYIALASANPRSPVDYGSDARRSAESWEQNHEEI